MQRLLLPAVMFAYRMRHWAPVERLTHDPDAAQRRVLRRMLAANRDTRFGREHGFATMRSHAEYQARVPVQDYETLRPYVDDQRRTGAPALTAEAPVFYAQTSGSTGAPKYIPITPTTLSDQRDEQALFSYLQYRAAPLAFHGKALGIMGAAVEGRLDSGHSVGSVSGYLYQSLPATVRARFVVPPEVNSITDYQLKYQVILLLALAQPEVSYLGSPNPSTFLRLLDILQERRDALLEALGAGTLDSLQGIARLEPAARTAVQTRLRANPARARALRQMPAFTFGALWPRIRLVTTWTGGSCGIAVERLRALLPPGAAVMELGYQATECRGTLALDPETPGGLPPLHHAFFEFVEQGRWDDGRPEFLTLGGLEPGRRYHVFVTNASGLYRYFMNDLLDVTGFVNRAPLLRFLQKGKGVTSLTGEKVYEAQAIDAVQQAAARQGVVSSFFVLVADAGHGAYRLFIESHDGSPVSPARLAEAVDQRLGELNIEYHAKRASGRLGALAVIPLARGTAEAYKAACVRAGQREGQFKPAVLQYAKDLPLTFDDHALRSDPADLS